jgi:hypothetical protein
MPRVNLSDGWTASGSVVPVRKALHTFLRASGMRVVGEQAGEVYARHGWWAAHVVGGGLAPAAWLPKRAVVKLRPGDGGVMVRASIEGSSPRMLGGREMNKYQTYFVRWMAGLKAVLR